MSEQQFLELAGQFKEILENKDHQILDYKKFVKIDKTLQRPSEVPTLLGNSKKAKKELKWLPKYNFKMLVADMVKSDLEFVKKEGY